MSILLRPWKHAFDFTGRSGRLEFLAHFVVIWVVLLTIGYLPQMMSPADSPRAVIAVAMSLFWLIAFVPTLALIVRRLHDQNRSGWVLVLTLIPVFNLVLLAAIAVWPGTKGLNRFDEERRRARKQSATPEELSGVFS